MADHLPALTCLIEGESSVFEVKPTADIQILELKDDIRKMGKNGVLDNVGAKDLILWKVRMVMGQRHHKTRRSCVCGQ